MKLLDLGAGGGIEAAGVRANGTGAGGTGVGGVDTGVGGDTTVGVSFCFQMFDTYQVPRPRTPTAHVRKTSILNELCVSSATALVTTVFFSDSELVVIIDAISDICFFRSDSVSSL